MFRWSIWFRKPELPITTPGIYHNSTLWLLSYSSDWSTWYTIADKDLWASEVYWQWLLYQRWNNYWFTLSNWNTNISTTQVDTTWYWPWNYYSDNTYIANWTWYSNWFNPDNLDLWWWTTGTYAAMQGPCPNWFHIPSTTDFNTVTWIVTTLKSSTDINDCKGYFYIGNISTIYNHNGNPYARTGTDYRTHISDWNSRYPNYAHMYSNYPWIGSIWSTSAFPIRPFKNEPVQPTTKWTRLI